MRRLNLLGAWVVVAGAAVTALGQSKPQTGDFDVSFSGRSPLTAPKELARRMATTRPLKDYDINLQTYRVVVPANYDPATPHALLVFLCYKDVTSGPPELEPIFEREHILFVAPKVHDLPDTMRAGLAADAVENMRKLYTVDPNRVWFMGNEPVATRTAIGFSDLFTGAFIRDFMYWKPVPTADRRASYKPQVPTPPEDLQAKAHRMVWVIGDVGTIGDYPKLSLAALRRDGYNANLVPTKVDPDYHYPHFTAEWFERVLPYLRQSAAPAGSVASPAAPAAPADASHAVASGADPAPPAASPATAPAGKPAASADASRQLGLAESYVAAKAYKPARTKLSAIIEKYPDDPAAAEARKLLDSIKDK